MTLERRKNFFMKVASSPSLIWKLGAGVLFLVLALAFLIYPSIIEGLSENSRYAFAGLLFVYGSFRLITFYSEFKSIVDD